MPSSWNWSPAIPALSAAVAVTAMVPVTVAPALGAVRATVGATVSGLKVAVTVVAADMITVHEPVPEQSPPLQPLKIDPEAGVGGGVPWGTPAALVAQRFPPRQ